MSIVWTPVAHDVIPKEPKPYTGRIERLQSFDTAFFLGRFEIPAHISDLYIRVDPETNRYVLPVYGPKGSIRGHVLRYAWNDAPRNTDEFYPKAQTFKNNDSPLQSFYQPIDTDSSGYLSAVVLVEDQISAIKLAAYGYSSVAILGKPTGRVGSYTGQDRVAEIARAAGQREVIVALDSDATADAFNFARVWGHAFHKCRVAILTDDIKDTKAHKLYEVLGV